MPPKGRRRPADSGDVAEPKEWGHPDGMELSEIDVDAEYEGVVTNVGRFGVFVDFGAVKDGLLKVPVDVGRGFKRGMEVKSLVVLSCDPDAGKVVLSPADESLLPEPVPRQRAQSQPPPRSGKGGGRGGRAAPKAGGSGRGGGSGSKGGRQSREPREWGHPDGTPLEEIQLGELWNGVITNVSPYGVFVDIGAAKDARLSVPTRIGRRFRIGDAITDCKIEEIDVHAGRMTVSLDDPEEVVKDLPPKEKPAPKAKPKAKSGAQARASSEPPPRTQSTSKAKAQARSKKVKAPSSIDHLRVGQVVDGVVGNKGPYGIFVDIGIGKDAKLLVPKKMMSRFQRNDEVCGMVVEAVDVEKNQIAVSLEDPELEGEAAPRGGAASAAKAVAKPKGKAKAQAKVKAGQSDWSHPNAMPISKFKAGQVANGAVTNVGSQGVFVDIGSVRDGVLKLSKALAKEFRVGDEVHGMLIESVDVSAERITLSLEEPELKEPGKAGGKGGRKASPSPGPAAPKAKTQAKAKAKAKAKGGEKSWGHAGGKSLQQLKVGASCNGVVTNRGKFGVFLDIGAVKDGKLRLQKDDWKKFMVGDEVEDMVIEDVDLDNEQIGLALTYELGDAPELDAVEVSQRAKAKPRPAKATSPAPQSGSRGQPKASSRSPGRGDTTRPATAKAKGAAGRPQRY